MIIIINASVSLTNEVKCMHVNHKWARNENKSRTNEKKTTAKQPEEVNLEYYVRLNEAKNEKKKNYKFYYYDFFFPQLRAS